MSHKILLIDESAMLRRITANVLQAQTPGYEVIAATRAAEGFARACAGDVELILLDYHIAGYADAELCRRLLVEPRTARIPTILLIGQAVQPPPLAALPLNVVEILSKPVAPEQLSGVVNAIRQLHRAKLSLEEMRAHLHPGSASHGASEAESRLMPNRAAEQNKQNADPEIVLTGPGATVAEQSGVYVFKGQVLRKGDTKTASLASVIRAVADRQLSGVLRLESGHGEAADMIFDEGRMLVLSTRDANLYASRATDTLPEKVSQATLEEALAEQRETGTPFLLTLGTGGLLSKSAAISLLRQFGQRYFARLWFDRTVPVRYEFKRLDTLPTFALRLEPAWNHADEWLLKAARQLRLEDVMNSLHHEGMVGTPFQQLDAHAILSDLRLSDEEQTFLDLAVARSPLPKIALAMKINQEAAYLMLYRFRCLDVLSYRCAPTAFVMTPRANLHRVLPLKR